MLGTLSLLASPASGAARWKSVAAGDHATCALSTQGVVSCWGQNTDGLLGPGHPYFDIAARPGVVAGVPRARSLSLTGRTACIVDRRGRVWCWGERRGKDSSERSRHARRVAGISGATSVTAATGAACAKRPGGVWCWAWGSSPPYAPRLLTRKTGGRIRMNDQLVCLVPGGGARPRCHLRAWDGLPARRLTVRLSAVADLWFAPEFDDAGAFNFCALTTRGAVRCAGDSLEDVLEHPTPGSDDTVARLPGTRTLALVTGDFACGSGPRGLLCGTTTAAKRRPVRLSGSRGAQAVGGDDAGGYYDPSSLASKSHVCVLTRGGRLSCLGDNADGRLGSGGGPRPGVVPGVRDAVEVVAGDSHACARSAAGAVHCWGGSSIGGEGPFTDDALYRPRAVALPGPATAIYAASDLTCAIVDRYPWCWGRTRSKAGSSASDVAVKLDRLGAVDALAVFENAVCGRAAGAPLQCVRAANGTSTLVWRAPSRPFGDLPVTTFTEVALNICALVSGEAVCRVVPGDSATPDPVIRYTLPAPGATSIVGGNWNSACLAGAGDIVCWGFEGYSGGSHGPEAWDSLRLRRPFGPSAGWQVATNRYAACAIPAAAGIAADVQCRPINTRDGDGASRWLFSGTAKATSVAVAESFACAVTTGRHVRCWGDGTTGGLGRGSDGGATSTLVPVPAPRR